MPGALGSGLFLGTPVHPGTSHFWVLLSIIVCSAFPDLPLFWHVFATTFVFKKKSPYLYLVSAGGKSWELYRHLVFCVRARYCSGNEGLQWAD